MAYQQTTGYTPQQIQELLRGKTPEQKKAINYFVGGGGCLSNGMTDAEYDAAVLAIVNSTNFKQKALNKIGVDESQVNEIEPVHFEGYVYDDKAFAKYGKDMKWRSSAYQISWIFFSDSQVYVYQYTFHMTDGGKKERTEDYFYKDITNFSTATDSVDKLVLSSGGCVGGSTWTTKSVESNQFALVVPGEKFLCSTEQSDYVERSIQGMKAKLREKKG